LGENRNYLLLVIVYIFRKKTGQQMKKQSSHSMGELGFPFRPVHPGELLKDELAYRHLSQRRLAKQLGLSYTAFNRVLNGKRPVTTDFALIMEAALGVSPTLLLRMQTDYNLQMAQTDSQLINRLAEIRQAAAKH
jgi:addiction module HigA family antidote